MSRNGSEDFGKTAVVDGASRKTVELAALYFWSVLRFREDDHDRSRRVVFTGSIYGVGGH